MTNMPRLVSLAVMTLLMIFLGITFFNVISPFLLPLFLAGVAAVICQPMYVHFLKRTKGRPRLAAGFTTGTVMVMVFVPLMLGTFIASVQLVSFAQTTFEGQKWDNTIDTFRTELQVEQITERLEAIFPVEIDQKVIQQHWETALRELGKRSLSITTQALGFVGYLLALVVSIFMFMIALYYYLADGAALLESAELLIPVHVNYQRRLLQQFNSVVRAVVLATFLAALSQALATALLLFFAGFHHFFIIFALASVSALIPLAGTWLVWGPCAIWLFLEGSWITGIIVVLIGALVIAMMDNVIRTYVLNSDAKLHPLLGFVSVLGGMQVMGLWGVFIGPIVASILHALVVIFNEELTRYSRDAYGQTDGPSPAKIGNSPQGTPQVSQTVKDTINEALATAHSRSQPQTPKPKPKQSQKRK